MLKIIESVNFSTVEVWKEEELLNLSQTVIFLPVEAIKTLPSLGGVPHKFSKNLN